MSLATSRSLPWILVGFFSSLVACSGASEDATPSTPEVEPRAVNLGGSYVPMNDDGNAPFAMLTIENATRYRLRARGCTSASCEEAGSFSIDMKNKSMTMDTDGTHRIYVLPFDVMTAPRMPNTSSEQTGGSLTAKDLTNGGGGKLIEGQSTLIEASSVLLDGQPYSNDDTIPRCDASPVFVGSSWSAISDDRAKEAARTDALDKCAAAACYQPGAPRKFLYCKIKYSECKPGRVYTTCEAYASGE